jgi:hypothetical protein
MLRTGAATLLSAGTVGALAFAAFTGAGTASAGEEAAAAEPLVVYNDNIENMLPSKCAEGEEFSRFLAYLEKQGKALDVFTVQQISDDEQLAALTKQLTDRLPGTYAGRIAIPEPGSMGYDSPCGKLKNQQTNAVIYRTDRLTPAKETRWRSDAPEDPDDGSGPCRNLEPTKTSQDRVHNIAVRFTDKATGKDVTVASIHWPTDRWHASECASENMQETADAVGRLGGTLQLAGGDTNADYDVDDWWNKGRDLGFRDPVAEQCGGPDCPPEYNTTKNHRIDFVLAKGVDKFTDVATLTDEKVGGAYSNHRAVTARVGY